MGAFLRKTGGSFQIFNEGKKDTQLTDLNKERLKDNVLLIHSSSNKTYDEEKVLELEAGEETVKKEHLFKSCTERFKKANDYFGKTKRERCKDNRGYL